MPSVDAAGTELSLRARRRGRADAADPGDERDPPRLGPPLPRQARARASTASSSTTAAWASRGRRELPFTIADLAGDARRRCSTRWRSRRAHVVGISMGGMIAQELALAHPERIRTLTLGATYCGGPEGTLMAPEDLQMLGAAYASGEPEQVFRAMWEINLSPGFRAEDSPLRRLPRDGLALPAPRAGGPPADAGLRRPRHQRPARPDRRSRRWSSTAPPTACSGRQRAADRRADPGSELELLEGVGHMFWWEQPERSAELIREHALAPV